MCIYIYIYIYIHTSAGLACPREPSDRAGARCAPRRVSASMNGGPQSTTKDGTTGTAPPQVGTDQEVAQTALEVASLPLARTSSW